ncbi:MAG: response regulator [Pseudomonas sp.]|uniref:response regulator transcription factor n=1 Tax=Pseudomonas sp. TaxID=306 RepID=UPI003BB7453E
MTNREQTVFVVDDEVSVRNSLKWLLESVQIPVQTFESGHAFLAAHTDNRQGCIVLDVRMPGMSGLELMKRLHNMGMRAPIIFLSAHGDVPMAVQALKDGAFDFLEKPYNNQRFLDCVQSALERDALNRLNRNADEELLERLKNLTVREQEIITLVVAGKSNKEIGKLLNISHKTVEAHRGRLMAKMGVNNLVDLVRVMTTHYAVNGNISSLMDQ